MKKIVSAGVRTFVLFMITQCALAKETPNQIHAKLFAKNRYPSANACQTCHEKQYREWSVSQHAYALLSPVFMAMHNATSVEQSTTNGDFCIRCHSPIAMEMKESMHASNLSRSAIAREGVTCVTCHRQAKSYGKVSARITLERGDILDAVKGPQGNKELARVLANPNEFKVEVKRGKQGRHIHRKIEKFFTLVTPRFCGSCHDVTLANGFRLEEAFSEYRHSPAAQAGETCQDCHMGKVPGKASGYDVGPGAKVGEKATHRRRLTNHYFAGPDYPIIHPGIFPFNKEAQEFATPKEWMRFNYRAGWGTDAFESHVSEARKFPKPWDSVDARYDARDILEHQFKLLRWAKQQRQQVLQNGYGIGEVSIEQATPRGVKFSIEVKNKTDGHNVPTGFIAERLVFLQVTVRDAKGRLIYQSGDRDANGDVRDRHSRYVLAGDLPRDVDLFSLQSKFLIRLLRGGEAEAVIPVNRSVDPRPFVRPSPFSAILTGQPSGARIHRKGIAPLDSRWADYAIPAKQLTDAFPYKVRVKLIAQMVPVNLIHRIQHVGFDFRLSSKTVARRVVAGAHVVAVRRFEIGPTQGKLSEKPAYGRRR